MGGVDVAAVGFRAILAELELAFDARNGDAEANDAGEHGAAKALGQVAPLFGIGWLVQCDQAFEQGVFAGFVFDQFHRAVGVDGDVVPGGNGERFDVKRGRDVAVRAGEDDQGFAAGEGLPVTIGPGEVAFDEAVFAFVLDDQREMGGDGRLRSESGADCGPKRMAKE